MSVYIEVATNRIVVTKGKETFHSCVTVQGRHTAGPDLGSRNERRD